MREPTYTQTARLYRDLGQLTSSATFAYLPTAKGTESSTEATESSSKASTTPPTGQQPTERGTAGEAGSGRLASSSKTAAEGGYSAFRRSGLEAYGYYAPAVRCGRRCS